MDDFERAWLCKVNIKYAGTKHLTTDGPPYTYNKHISIVTNSRKNIYIKKCGTISTINIAREMQDTTHDRLEAER